MREAGQKPPWMDLVSSQDLTGNSTSVQGQLHLPSPCSLEQWELLNCHLVSAKGPGLPLNPLLLPAQDPSTVTLPASCLISKWPQPYFRSWTCGMKSLTDPNCISCSMYKKRRLGKYSSFNNQAELVLLVMLTDFFSLPQALKGTQLESDANFQQMGC